jgi:hypothetical protein
MRVEYPGAIYHVMDRGERRHDIFVDDVDRQDILKTVPEACQKTAWQTPFPDLASRINYRCLRSSRSPRFLIHCSSALASRDWRSEPR